MNPAPIIPVGVTTKVHHASGAHAVMVLVVQAFRLQWSITRLTAGTSWWML